CAMGTWAMDYW
nr:immunoglobulin heavy chain junction region [Mus musculus]